MKETNQDKKANSESEKKVAVIRVRGLTGVRFDIDATLDKLRLTKRNCCAVVQKNEGYLGMIMKAKDYVTWGEIDEDTYNALLDKRREEFKGAASDRRGKIQSNKFIEVNGEKIKKVFRLNSPRKGYGRKGIKYAFNIGGALGYRGEKINDLIMRMI
ncbi:MAG: uL30 family ribosomal protein [Nanoarchaeota archaeon]